MKDSEKLFEMLRRSPGETTLMVMLSDALNEEDNERMAYAFFWAADNRKWPFQRWGRPGRYYSERWMYPAFIKSHLVWDWDLEGRSNSHADVPRYARLPKPLYEAIRRNPRRWYGDIWQAFVLLANALNRVERSDEYTVAAKGG